MKPRIVTGYPMVTLHPGPWQIRVHALVLLAFVGPCPEGMECCHHPDPCKANVSLSNLSWGTRQTNMGHKHIHGTTACGEKQGSAKLTASQVREIRDDYAAGLATQQELADRSGVSQLLVSKIVRRLLWKHVV